MGWFQRKPSGAPQGGEADSEQRPAPGPDEDDVLIGLADVLEPRSEAPTKPTGPPPPPPPRSGSAMPDPPPPPTSHRGSAFGVPRPPDRLDSGREVPRPPPSPAPAPDPEVTRVKTPTPPRADDDDAEQTLLRQPKAATGAPDHDDARTVLREPGSDADPATVASPAQGLGDTALPQGTKVGRYLLLERIGVGGMGSVYAAYDPELDRRVALKLLHAKHDENGSSGGARGRLLREAQAMAKLSHPSIAAVHDVGLFGDQVFMAMEFVEGVTLRDWIRSEKRPWRRVLDRLLQAGDGLAAAHKAGIIHRDFKPSNVMIGADDRVRVLDFGLARRTDQGEDSPDPNLGEPDSPPDLAEGEISVSVSRSSLDLQLTHAGSIMGSPAYMSPEQHMARPTDPRSDQFSFCVALFEGLYGERPFISEDQRMLVYAILEQRIRPPPRDSKVARGVHRAVMRGLSVNPGDRFGSMDALLAQLRRNPARPLRYVFGVAVVATVVGLGVLAFRPAEVTQDALAQVDAIATKAHEAAAKSLFVYPPPEQPETPTAYAKVLALEELRGELAEPARLRAKELRLEFAQTLVYLGDRYWEQEGGKAFALDYYAQALVFDEDNERSKERASMTVGQLADLRRKATEAGFSRQELAAAEPLLALAEDNEEKRLEKLEDMLAQPDADRSAANAAQLSRLVESEEIRQGRTRARNKAESRRSSRPKPTPSNVEIVDSADGEGPKQQRTATRQKRDPKQAKQLAAQGHAALKAAHWAEAEGLFHRALSYNRRSGSALIGLSDVYFNRADRRKAIEYAERAVAIAPRHAGYRIRLGDAYFKALRYDDAKAEYLEAERRGSSRAQSRLAKVERKVGGG